MKKIVSMILLLSMIVCMIPAVSLTATAATTQTVEIGTLAELQSALSSANSKTNTEYKLTKSINGNGDTLNGTLYLKDGAVFNGNGFAITNFKTANGIFTIASGATVTVKGLRIGSSAAPVTVTGTTGSVAAFVGETDATITFEECDVYVTATSATLAHVAGYVANYTGSKLTFNNCTANGTVQNSGAVITTEQLKVYPAAGFVAKVTNSATLSFVGCVNNATVSSDAIAAGFVGYAGGEAVVVDGVAGYSATTNVVNASFVACENTGTISGTSGKSYVAGFFPLIYSNGRVTFDRCVNAGNITGGAGVAGYVSWVEQAVVKIGYSINKGNISTATNAHLGGFTGRVKNNLTATNCINTGSISSSVTVGNVGQIASKTDTTGTFINCYALGNYTAKGSYSGAIVGFADGADITAQGNKYVASATYNTYFAVDQEKDVVTSADFDKLTSNILMKDESNNDVIGAPALRGVQETVISGGKHTIRLLAAVDTANYKTVGMTVTTKVNGVIKRQDSDLKCTTLYEGVTAVSDKNGTVAAHMAKDAPFAGKYLMALCLTGVPTTKGLVEITVTPYGVAKDGTRYEGTETKIQYAYSNDGTAIENITINGIGQADEWTNAFGMEIPKYPYGTMREETYTQNAALGQIAADETQYKMFMVTDTTSSEFESYITELKNDPACTVTDASNAIDGISGYWIETAYTRMYAYMVAKKGHAAFILDRIESQTTNTEFSDNFNYTGSGDITFYLYGLTYDDVGVNIGENYQSTLNTNNSAYQTALNSKPWIEKGAFNPNFKNCGMMLVVKLADDSVIIVDGGHEAQMSDEAAIEFNRFLHDITGKSMDRKVTIKAWYISHPHGDHFGGFIRFLNSFHEYYDMERVMFNMTQGYPGDIRTIMDGAHAGAWYPDLQFHRLHTGETIKLGGAELDVMFTQEDLTYDHMDPNTGHIVYKSNDDNSSSVLMRFRFDGIKVMVTADMSVDGEDEVVKMYNASALKADVFQAAHHTWNKLSSLCASAAPSYILHAQSYGGTQFGLYGGAYNNYNDYLNCMNSSLTDAQKKANNYFGGGTTTQDASGKLWQTTTATGISAMNGSISVNVVQLDTPKPGFNANEKLVGDWSTWSEIKISHKIIDKGWGDIFDFDVK